MRQHVGRSPSAGELDRNHRGEAIGNQEAAEQIDFLLERELPGPQRNNGTRRDPGSCASEALHPARGGQCVEGEGSDQADARLTGRQAVR